MPEDEKSSVVRLVRKEEPLTNIPEMLRGLAGLIERGEKPAQSVLVIRDNDGQPPCTHAYGYAKDFNQAIGIMARAQHELCKITKGTRD